MTNSSRTYDQHPDSLPPLTQAIVTAYGPRTGSHFGDRPRNPGPAPAALSAMLDAIHELETRVTALEDG